MTTYNNESNPARFVNLLAEGRTNGWTEMLSHARDRVLDNHCQALLEEQGSSDPAAQSEITSPFPNLDGLLRQLQTNKPEQQEEVLRNLLQLGPDVISYEIRSALVELLAVEDDVLRDLATGVVCRLGASATSSALSRQVANLLSNRSGMSWDQGIALIEHVGATVITDEVRSELQSLARGADESGRSAALRALRQAEFSKVVFLLRAAADESASHPLRCVSESGLWTLEVFVGTSVHDRATERGSLLMIVHPENRVPYEGCTASVFVGDAGAKTVLAEGVIVDGELFSEISLAGLNLHHHDKVWVTFGPKATRS